jgi:hypothetical protein
MVSGLVSQKNICNDVELARNPVLDDNFPQNGTIAIFIVTLAKQYFLFLVSSRGPQ